VSDFVIESSDKLLDNVGWEILSELQHDARLSYAEIGRRVGLSAPAVMERVHRLEEAGIITGYCAQVDVTRLGLPIIAMIRVRYPGERYPQIRKMAETCANVLECHHITGEDCMFIKVAVESMPHLESLIEGFAAYGQTTTSLVLASPVTGRVIDRRPNSKA
jgi:Lrp/AsnC family leucine-responsive transcriptional regulator